MGLGLLLGFAAGAVVAVVAARAGFLALFVVVIGVAIGIIGGRIAWEVYADRSGFIAVVPVPVPVLALFLIGAPASVGAELCAAVPAHIASRTRPARLLRSE